MTGHPKVVFPRRSRNWTDTDPRPQMMIGQTLRREHFAHTRKRLPTGTRPFESGRRSKIPGDKDKFLAGEVFPDESKLYED